VSKNDVPGEELPTHDVKKDGRDAGSVGRKIIAATNLNGLLTNIPLFVRITTAEVLF
jgi:hypothetical protein